MKLRSTSATGLFSVSVAAMNSAFKAGSTRRLRASSLRRCLVWGMGRSVMHYIIQIAYTKWRYHFGRPEVHFARSQALAPPTSRINLLVKARQLLTDDPRRTSKRQPEMGNSPEVRRFSCHLPVGPASKLR